MTTETETRTTHTPGPWTVSGDEYPIGILAPHRFGVTDPEVVCQIGADIMTPEDTDECEANARLIAQAPAMLALLRILAESYYTTDLDDVNTGHNASYRDMARDILRAVVEGAA